MVQELIQKTWCDIHATKEQEYVDGQTRSFSFDGKLTDIDLCEQCLQEVEEALDTARQLLQYGRSTTLSGPQRGQQRGRRENLTCKVCGEKGFPSKRLLGAHYGVHVRRGEAQPRPVNQLVPVGENGYACPACGQVFATVQGVTMHQVRKHGYVRGKPSWEK